MLKAAVLTEIEIKLNLLLSASFSHLWLHVLFFILLSVQSRILLNNAAFFFFLNVVILFELNFIGKDKTDRASCVSIHRKHPHCDWPIEPYSVSMEVIDSGCARKIKMFGVS